jgi:hypothetical protein
MWLLYIARKISTIAGMKIPLQTEKSKKSYDNRLDQNIQLTLIHFINKLVFHNVETL